MEVGSGIAVKVQDIILYRKICHQLIGIQILFEILPFRQSFQCPDDAQLVFLSRIRFRIVENIRIIRKGVSAVSELCPFGIIFRLYTVLYDLFVFFSRRIQFFGIGFIQYTALPSGPFQEGFIHFLHNQEESVIQIVDSDPGIAAERRISPRFAEHGIAEVILHTGGITEAVVQAEFLYSVIGLSLFIFAEIELQAVAVDPVALLNHLQAGISLCGTGNILNCFSVNNDFCPVFSFLFRILQKIFPVTGQKMNINGMHSGRIKETAGIGKILRFWRCSLSASG